MQAAPAARTSSADSTPGRPAPGQLRLGLENLLNEDYFTYFAQTEPNARADTFFKGNGRTFGLSWRVDF